MTQFYRKSDCSEVSRDGFLTTTLSDGTVVRYSASNVFDWWSDAEIEAVFDCVIPVEQEAPEGKRAVAGSARLELVKDRLTWVSDYEDPPAPLEKAEVLAAVEVLVEQKKVEEAETKAVALIIEAQDGRVNEDEAKAFLAELSEQERGIIDGLIAPVEQIKVE